MALTLSHHSLLLPRSLPFHQIQNPTRKPTSSFPAFRCSSNPNFKTTLKTCKNCKTQFDPSLNHPQACRFHTAHFGDSAVLGVYNLWRVLRTKRHSVKGIYFLLRSTIKAFHEKWKKRNYCSLIEAKHLGETRRKFESVYSGGTMDTPDSGQVFQYWHCCGSEDPFDPGCTAAPHSSYDD